MSLVKIYYIYIQISLSLALSLSLSIYVSLIFQKTFIFKLGICIYILYLLLHINYRQANDMTYVQKHCT